MQQRTDSLAQQVEHNTFNVGVLGSRYHVLGGIISPMDGIGPSDIEIESLVQRVAEGGQYGFWYNGE